MTIRLPRLLDASLQETARLSPVKLALHERLLPLSTAEMVLPYEGPELRLRDLIELFDANGSAGIFRVKHISATAGHTRTISLEHSLCTLRDSIVPAHGFMATVPETLARLLALQNEPLWAVGEVETPEDLTIIFATGYTDLLSALEALLGMLPEGYALTFDQTVTPWLMHLRRLTEEDVCEGRLHRNMSSVRHEVDGSRLCTRVYPFGVELEGGPLSLVPLTGSDHVQSSAADSLGVISRTFESDLIFDAPSLQDVAQLYLARHAEPETTTVVSAVDLSSATGESLDAFRTGRICRLCLPELGQVITHRIIAIDQPDLFSAPGQAVLTLSNRLKQQSESAEIDELVRLVTAGKLLGGTVTEVTSNNRAYGTNTSPVVHYFTIEDWPALLDVRITFKADTGASIRDVRVDSVRPEDDVWSGGAFSAMPYLRRDELGQIAQGQHWVAFHPSTGTDGESSGVTSAITMTVIQNTTT